MDHSRDKTDVSTQELLQLLSNANTLEGFLDTNAEHIPNTSVTEYLKLLLERHQMSRQSALQAANLDYSLGYQILNGYRNPRRNALIRLAIGMHLSLDETQHLLKIAQRGELYPKNRRDAAILYCISHHLNLINTEIILEKIGEELLD